VVKRRTDRMRLVRKLKELRTAAWRRMHAPVGIQREWYRVLNRRSQRRLLWPRFYALLERFPLPCARITHPRPVLTC
jgi:hypothetical protein